MLRLLLINPTSASKGLGNITVTAWPPLNLPYLAGVTPKHYQIEVIDENIEPFEYRNADIVGITSYTSSIYRAYQISQIYRKKGIPTVMGGIHVSMLPEEALDYCDAVVVGEAEGVWPKVLEDFENGILKKKYYGTWTDLDSLPLPRRDILKNSYYKWGSIQTSRGCPMNCTFCCVTAFNGRRFRRRSVDAVIEELQQIPQKRVMLTDDNIIGYGKKDLEWAQDLFSKILEKGIKKHFFAQATLLIGKDRDFLRLAAKDGLRIVLIGMESINSKTLQSYQKGINLKQLHQNQYANLVASIRKQGVAIVGAFILGGDDDNRSIFHSTLTFVKTAQIDVFQATKPTPLPGTQFWKALHEKGRILSQDFPKAWEEYRFTKMVFKPAQMSIDEVYKGFTYLRNAYYGIWETVKRTSRTLIVTKSISATIIAYKFNMSFKKAFKNSPRYKIYNKPGLKKEFMP